MEPVLNVWVLSSFAGYTLSDTKTCVNAGLKVGANIKGVYVSVGASGGSCDALLKEFGGEPKSRFKLTLSSLQK